MCAHFLFIPANTWFSSRSKDEQLSLSPQIVGFNETIRNWHEEWCFTSSDYVFPIHHCSDLYSAWAINNDQNWSLTDMNLFRSDSGQTWLLNLIGPINIYFDPVICIQSSVPCSDLSNNHKQYFHWWIFVLSQCQFAFSKKLHSNACNCKELGT